VVTGAPPDSTVMDDFALGTTTPAAVVRGGLWNVVTRVIPQLQILVLSVVAARFLGPDEMGRQSFIAFAGLSLVALATAGPPPALARFVGELLGAKKDGQALSLYHVIRRLELLAGALALAALVAIAALGGDPAGAWVLSGVAAGLAVLQAVPSSLLTGAQRWREVSLAGVVCGAASVPLTIGVLAAGGGITGIFAVEAATALVTLLWTSALAQRLVRRLRPPEPLSAGLRRSVLVFAAASAAIGAIHLIVWRRSELLVMDQVSSDAEIALYSIAFAVVSGLARLPDSVEAVAMPAVATLIGRGERDRVRAGFWRSLRLLAVFTPALVAGAAATGPALIELAYGREYRGAGPVMLVMLAPLLVLPLFSMSEAVLFAFGRLRFLLLAGVAGALVDATLALVLIPELDAIGAALANVAAQLAAGLPMLMLLARLQRPVDVALYAIVRGIALAGLLAAAAIGAQELLGTSALGLAAAVAAGVAVFAAAGPLLRPLTSADAEWLAAALGGRGVLARAARRLG
jgi:O-antigen/teichoic acid export membrane protein